MTYLQAETYLNTLPAFHHVGATAYKPGLERMEALMSDMGHPHSRLRCVHIAGTNGKGSTSSMIAAGLMNAGERVGLYTSPHLIDWRERIRIDGEEIDCDYVAEWVTRYQRALEQICPSYFEALTALAFCYFADKQVDWAVIECGLGGRLDSTNIITPRLSVITNIGLDHTAILGDTRQQIAAEKAGIIKEGIPCIVGEQDAETAPVFTQTSHSLHAALTWADSCPYYDGTVDLHGDYQHKNARTAAAALRSLGYEPDLTDAARRTGLRGRWEVLSQRPLTICDTGHNSHGIRTYVEQLKRLMEEHRDAYLRIVFGMVNDKDVTEVMRLLPRDAFYYWTSAQTERAIDADQMRQMGLMHGLIGKAFPSVAEAIRAISIEAEEDDVVFIGGSNFIVGEWISQSEKK